MNRSLLYLVAASVMSCMVAACGAAPAPTLVPTLVPPTNTIAAASANACATDDHAPPGAFRSDPVSKLTASAKPKFIEFYGSW